jgi:hypothetical protein
MKYGVVKVTAQEKRNPIAAASPNVWLRRRYDGISPPRSHANGAIMPFWDRKVSVVRHGW